MTANTAEIKVVRLQNKVMAPSSYQVFRAQADWTLILPSQFPAKELCHLPRNMPPRGTTY
jgi:hypothetical protein